MTRLQQRDPDYISKQLKNWFVKKAYTTTGTTSMKKGTEKGTLEIASKLIYAYQAKQLVISDILYYKLN